MNFLLKNYLQRATPKHHKSSYGFTLIEMMITVFIIGILSAIVAPSWIGFVDARRLNTAQDQVYRAMREAQSNAKRDKSTWQASFREATVVFNQQNKVVTQWAVHPDGSTPANWNNLEDSIRIVDTDINSSDPNLTTLYFDSATNLYRIQFNYKGVPDGQWGKITLSTRNGGQAKSCVSVSTLLGAMKTAKDSACVPN